ncbi:Phosphatidylethanolamine-binding protein PEBP [Corchorus olitorius]|uniref:Phosphatidylethanolamine-binding protein PEBP n=1 Tax=Corchorus olitorius TaxID=93759 RepID=A0A1R3H419_9ROSI|nr:Phosphatidylethanolamine-binding protein PEBP [Corchorus olitorius]
MARSVEPLVVGRVIGDVLDMFTPAATVFTAHYGSKQVMVDPDAPSPSEPRLREIVVDIPHGHDATKGRELVPYMGPCPPTGIHRYILALFKQERAAAAGGIQLPNGRANFNTRQFAAQNGLGLPVAALYFNSHKEPALKKR